MTSMSISRSPTGIAVAAGRGSNSATPETHSSIQPKIEDSPPPNRTYDQILQRQTVLMWGSNNHSRSSDDVPLSTRSPCDTPKAANNSFGNFHANNSNNNVLPVAATYDKQSKEIEGIQSTPHHIKWNGNACGNNKEVISIFPIHHSSETSSPSASSNALHDTRYSNHTRHNEISNCEVWPAYSQYQYFPYHHVSNAHHQHPTSTQ